MIFKIHILHVVDSLMTAGWVKEFEFDGRTGQIEKLIWTKKGSTNIKLLLGILSEVKAAKWSESDWKEFRALLDHLSGQSRKNAARN